MDYSLVHYQPAYQFTRNVRCLNGSAHIQRETHLQYVTCPLCLDINTNKEFWDEIGNRAMWSESENKEGWRKTPRVNTVSFWNA